MYQKEGICLYKYHSMLYNNHGFQIPIARLAGLSALKCLLFKERRPERSVVVARTLGVGEAPSSNLGVPTRFLLAAGLRG